MRNSCRSPKLPGPRRHLKDKNKGGVTHLEVPGEGNVARGKTKFQQNDHILLNYIFTVQIFIAEIMHLF